MAGARVQVACQFLQAGVNAFSSDFEVMESTADVPRWGSWWRG